MDADVLSARLPTTLAAVTARQAVVDADIVSARERLALARAELREMRTIAAALRPRAPPVALRAAPPVAAPGPAPVELPPPPPDDVGGLLDDDAIDDDSDACASPPDEARWRRHYDAETKAHYWYDACAQVVSWSDPERPPRDPSRARRPTAASLARSRPGSPQRLRFHCCAVESTDSEPEAPAPPARRPAPGYLKARRLPRWGDYEKGQFAPPRRLKCVQIITARRRGRAARGPPARTGPSCTACRARRRRRA